MMMAKKIKGFGGRNLGRPKRQDNIQKLMENVQKAQQMFQEKREELERRFADEKINVEVGGGVLKITASLDYRIHDLMVEDEDLKEDFETLKDLILAGMNRVLEEINHRRDEAYKELEESLLQIPGGNILEGGV